MSAPDRSSYFRMSSATKKLGVITVLLLPRPLQLKTKSNFEKSGTCVQKRPFLLKLKTYLAYISKKNRPSKHSQQQQIKTNKTCPLRVI